MRICEANIRKIIREEIDSISELESFELQGHYKGHSGPYVIGMTLPMGPSSANIRRKISNIIDIKLVGTMSANPGYVSIQTFDTLDMAKKCSKKLDEIIRNLLSTSQKPEDIGEYEYWPTLNNDTPFAWPRPTSTLPYFQKASRIKNRSHTFEA